MMQNIINVSVKKISGLSITEKTDVKMRDLFADLLLC
jgi:hypothetical protein